MQRAFGGFHAIRVILIALAVTLPAAGSQAAKRVALVIGNGAYSSVPALPNPPNDANDIGDTLARLGFSVSRVRNARYDEMRRALLAFGRQARAADIAIVFYAGHGIEVGGENWLIPTDAELRSDIDVEQEAIGLKSVMLTVQSASNLGLVILDACRNNPFAAKMKRSIRTRAVARGLVGVEPSGNVLVAYAAKDGTTASDGDGRNSPFTAALLKHIETPGLEINFLFRNVRDDVMTTTKREQQPFVYGSLSKERIFLKAPLPAPAVAAPRPAGPKPDELTWALIKDTNDPGALRRFVDQFPNSKLRAQAERREAELIAAAKSAKAAAEERMAALAAAANAAKEEAERRAATFAAEARAAKAAAERLQQARDAAETRSAKEASDKAAKALADAQAAKLAAEKRIAALAAEVEAAKAASEQASKLDPRELARSVQLELKRVGCFDDAVDGQFGDRTRAALRNFAKYASVRIDSSGPSEGVLKAIRGADKRICPLVCGAGEKVEGDRCVRLVCPAGQVVKDGACVAVHAGEPQVPSAAPRARAGKKCFSFGGKEFCE